MTGPVVSTTLTVLVTLVLLLLSSVAVYVRVYVPTVFILTVPVMTTFSPPFAVAPGSLYVEYLSTVNGLAPCNVITGAVVSTTLTVLVTLVLLLLSSVAVYVRVYVPT